MSRESGESSHGGYAPGMDTRRLLRFLATALGTAGLLVSGCSSGGSAPSASATGSAATEELEPYYGQKLRWRDCGVEGFQCATMKAPLDYAKPDGGDVKLAVSVRRPPVRASGSARSW